MFSFFSSFFLEKLPKDSQGAFVQSKAFYSSEAPVFQMMGFNGAADGDVLGLIFPGKLGINNKTRKHQ